MSTTIIDPPQSPMAEGPSPEELKLSRRATRRYGLFAPHLMRAALKQSFVMLRPDIQWKNPGDVRGRGGHGVERRVHRRAVVRIFLARCG